LFYVFFVSISNAAYVYYAISRHFHFISVSVDVLFHVFFHFCHCMPVHVRGLT